MKIFWCILLLGIYTRARAQANLLYCYECDGDNCDNLDDSKTVYCGPDLEGIHSTTATVNTEILSTVELGSTTTQKTEMTSTASDTTTSLPDSSATTPDESAIAENTTTSFSDSSATTSDESEIAENTTTSFSDSSATTSDESEIAENTTTSFSDSSATTSDESEIAENTATSFLHSSATTSDESEIAENTTTSLSDVSSTMTSTSTPDESSATEKSTHTETTSPVDETSSEATTTSETTLNDNHFISRRKRSWRESDLHYSCYKINYKDAAANQIKVHRGCVAIRTEETGCEAVKKQLADTIDPENINSCHMCLMNKCNSSSMLEVSITLLLVAIAGKHFV